MGSFSESLNAALAILVGIALLPIVYALMAYQDIRRVLADE